MGRSVLPNIEQRDIEFMEKVLSIGTKPHKFAIRVQAVLGRARSQSTNDLAMIIGMNFGTPPERGYSPLPGGLGYLRTVLRAVDQETS